MGRNLTKGFEFFSFRFPGTYIGAGSNVSSSWNLTVGFVLYLVSRNFHDGAGSIMNVPRDHIEVWFFLIGFALDLGAGSKINSKTIKYIWNFL